MKPGWIDRLKMAIAADGRSSRAISTAAGLGTNFVQQMLKNGKEPGMDHLIRLLSALGDDAALYVMTGLRATRADLDFLEAVQAAPEGLRENVLGILLSAQGRVSAPTSLPGHDRKDRAK